MRNTSLIYFGLTLVSVMACKTKAPVVQKEPAPDYSAQMRQTQREMENTFVGEHDLFIKLYDRSKQKEEIPYPQLHILIDSIQDFRNMHEVFLEYIEAESEAFKSPKLTSESRKMVEDRILTAKADADKVQLRYTVILQQIGNLKAIYKVKEHDGVDWIADKRMTQRNLQIRMDKQMELIKSESTRLGLNSLEEPETIAESNPEVERLSEMMEVHTYCEQYYGQMVQVLNKAEASLMGTTWYEGPFIEQPAITGEFEKARFQAVQIMNEFDFLVK